MNWYKKAQYETMSPEELEKYEFDDAKWGHSITPKDAFEKRENKNQDKDQFESLYDLATYGDTWRLNNALGKGWEGHWDNVKPSTYLISKIKNGDLITIYRASKEGGILPGAYVTESKEYAIFHGETTLLGEYKISSINVYPDELMVYDDPHEFIYIPRNLQIAHERLK